MEKMSFVSPINTITLDCSGNVLPNALLLADVDSNKSNELLVGTQDGELLIYKIARGQNDVKLWRRAQGLGFITAITVGSLLTHTSEHRSLICVVNAEGAIHLFHLRSAIQRSRVRSDGGTINSGSRNDSKLQLHGSTTSSNDEEQQLMQAAFSQQLICNPKMVLVQDYNENERQVVIGYCDRMIRIFTSIIAEDFDGRLSGRIALKYVFNVAEQIHTINVRRMSTRDYELIVSQPGGNLLRFNPNEENGRILATEMCGHSATGWTEAISVDKFFDETVYAIVCQDHINIYPGLLNRVLNKIPLSVKTGYLCGLRKGPTTGDDYNQIIAISSVDGDTFIIDRHVNIVRFRPPLSSYTGCGSGNDSIANATFCDQIQAFTAGSFGDNNLFCFIYVLTHNDKIIIVHSVEISNVKATNLLPTLEEKCNEAALTPAQLADLLHPQC